MGARRKVLKVTESPGQTPIGVDCGSTRPLSQRPRVASACQHPRQRLASPNRSVRQGADPRRGVRRGSASVAADRRAPARQLRVTVPARSAPPPRTLGAPIGIDQGRALRERGGATQAIAQGLRLLGVRPCRSAGEIRAPRIVCGGSQARGPIHGIAGGSGVRRAVTAQGCIEMLLNGAGSICRQGFVSEPPLTRIKADAATLAPFRRV